MYFRYLGRELRRRARSAALVAIGLALGVGLVITVTAYASGIKAAQAGPVGLRWRMILIQATAPGASSSA